MRGDGCSDRLTGPVFQIKKFSGGIDLKKEIFTSTRQPEVYAAVFKVERAHKIDDLFFRLCWEMMGGAWRRLNDQAMVDSGGIFNREFSSKDHLAHDGNPDVTNAL